ncbi:MAG: YlxR family protein [Armatimonadetes bacterium]|nr:YlxR family protein [Armatimonadota bacterium]MDW8153503.1 YlxR family protein [Armatimonadota bacterium]
MRQRKVPIRMCVGCGQMRPKMEMIRVVRTPAGEVVVDTSRSRKLSGRGAYVDPNWECLASARKGKKLERALEVPVPEEVYGQLEAMIRPSVRTTAETAGKTEGK